MTAKKKKQAQPNPLKIVAISSFAIALILNLYTWWSSDDLLNTLSTTSATFGWTLAGPFITFAVLIGLLYFLIARPKLDKAKAKKLGWWALILISVSWIFFSFPNLKDRIDPQPDTAPFVTLQGKLIKKDVPNGPGIYTITEQDIDNTTEVHVGPKEGVCDDQAVNIPELEVGEDILVYAKQYDELGRYVSICAQGTYIRKL